MFRLDSDFFGYLKDLSDPDFSSSNAIEAYQEKRKIVRLVLLTFFFGAVVLMGAVLFLMFYLPGLFNVTFQVIGELAGYVLFNWPLFLLFGLFFVVFLFLYLRS